MCAGVMLNVETIGKKKMKDEDELLETNIQATRQVAMYAAALGACLFQDHRPPYGEHDELECWEKEEDEK